MYGWHCVCGLLGSLAKGFARCTYTLLFSACVARDDCATNGQVKYSQKYIKYKYKILRQKFHYNSGKCTLSKVL